MAVCASASAGEIQKRIVVIVYKIVKRKRLVVGFYQNGWSFFVGFFGVPFLDLDTVSWARVLSNRKYCC